jgi:SOS-response transcriptional repressor LexA
MDNPEDLAGSDDTGISVHTGFPNPAADRRGTPLKLDQLLLHHPSSNFMFRVRGHAFETQGIFDGDLALVDKALTPRTHDLVINWQGQEFSIVPFAEFKDEAAPWGVVTAVIHEYRRAT